ncbi:MAG TPA: metal-sensing transcriptional repressor [Chloroflexota bacterium]|nr:metal-sensing transcriptional repressor [Chloroflexota bacterium]
MSTEAPAAGVSEGHAHHAPHRQTDAVIRRLKRAEGHLAAVRRMVEEGRDCPDVLLQIAAVRAALDSTARVVLADHLESCLHDATHNGDANDASATWNDLRRALESFIR